jgi:hypothetical protein
MVDATRPLDFEIGFGFEANHLAVLFLRLVSYLDDVTPRIVKSFQKVLR